MTRGTVVVVDLVGYSDIAKLLEQHISAGSVADLNRQIQRLIADALAGLSPEGHCAIARTGDGAILLFDRADDAHTFAFSLHSVSRDHNVSRTESTAKRWFRVGIATGPVEKSSCEDRPDEFAGITIANAVRLESAARAGEIVIDAVTATVLSQTLRSLYSEQQAVRGKRKETFAAHKLRVVDPKFKTQKVKVYKFSRRHLIGLLAGTSGAVAVASYFASEPITEWLHPLPSKRFVALMAWPETAQEAKSVLASVMHTIASRLARAESSVPDLLVIPESDLANQSNAPGANQISRQPAEVAALLGATLIFTAHTLTTGGLATITLQVLDAASRRVLRHQKISADLEQPFLLNEQASVAAAKMLHLPVQEVLLSDEEELKHVSVKAYRAYTDAQTLFGAPNDSQLDQAIAKFQEALADAPNFAVAYAWLAIAYAAKYERFANDADLDLASNSAQRAVELNPESISALLAQSEVYLRLGKSKQSLDTVATCLKLDPSNPEALLLQAEVYRDLGQHDQEENIYKKIKAQRPFYWRAYNDLGVAQKADARYEEAEKAFNQASELAPHASVPLANLAMMYVLLKDKRAEKTFRSALDRAPDTIALIGLGGLKFDQGDYQSALDLFSQASKVSPGDPSCFRDMADCYSVLSQPEKARANFAIAADLLYARLSINPTPGIGWAKLAFYDAKSGNKERAVQDLTNASQRHATDVDSDFYRAQALAVLGRYDEALTLVLKCIDRNLSPVDVHSALDLAAIESDPRYKSRLALREKHPSA